MEIYKIKKETDQYKDYMKCFTWTEKWKECETKIEDLLGVGIEGYLFYTPGRLTMQKLPPHLAKDFCKPYIQNGNEEVFKAKQSSKINKQWVEFCKENDLPEPMTLGYLSFLYNLMSFSGDYGRYKMHLIQDDDLFIEVTSKGKDWSKLEWVESFQASEFLKLKAKELENKGL